MHFVAVKTEAQQALGMPFRTHDLLVRQRTETSSALRVIWPSTAVAPQGRARVAQLAGVTEDGELWPAGNGCRAGPAAARPVDELDEKIDGLAGKLATSAREHKETARLMTIPGIGLS